MRHHHEHQQQQQQRKQRKDVKSAHHLIVSLLPFLRPFLRLADRPNKLVWHGAANKAGYRDLTNNCDGWHSDSLTKFGTATALHNPRNHATQQQQKRRHKKRFAANQSPTSNLASLADRRNSSSSGFGFFEPVEKFPCRMPLVVLCIETIGQPILEAKARQSPENSWDFELR